MNMTKPEGTQFSEGDLVTLKSSKDKEHFCIIAFKINEKQEPMAVLKALFNETYIIEKPVFELQSLLIKGQL